MVVIVICDQTIMSSIDFDPAIKLCLKYLHSSATDSTEQLRLTLDDFIRQTYGSAKTLGNVLPKKYLNEEKLGSPRSKLKNEKASSSKTIPIPQQSPQQIQIPERENDDGSVMDGELAFDLLEEDLTCVVCRQIAVQAGNRLVECDACHALYHQVNYCLIYTSLTIEKIHCWLLCTQATNPKFLVVVLNCGTIPSLAIIINNQKYLPVPGLRWLLSCSLTQGG